MTSPSLRQITSAVALDVNRTVGGGYASMELLRRRFAAHGWLDAASHGLLLAVSRLTPGTNILAYCVLLGWRFHRSAGAVLALAAASLPASLVVGGLTAALVRVDRYPAVQAGLAIGILAAAALVLASAWTLMRPHLTPAARQTAVIVTAVSAVLIVLGATPVRTLLAAAAVGLLLPSREPAKGAPPFDIPAESLGWLPVSFRARFARARTAMRRVRQDQNPRSRPHSGPRQ